MRIVPRHELVAQRARDIAKVVDIVAKAGAEDAATRRRRNVAGDHRVLRMIPVIAANVGGTVPGTDPFAAYAEQEARSARHGLAA